MTTPAWLGGSSRSEAILRQRTTRVHRFVSWFLPVLPLLAIAGAAGSGDPSAAAPAEEAPVYRVARASAPIRIDGVLDEFDWNAAERLRFLKIKHAPEDDKPLREETLVMALWDDENLYLAYIIQDREIWATLRKRDAKLWPEECVEFFFDPDGTGRRFTETQINSLNNIRDLLGENAETPDGHTKSQLNDNWDMKRLRKAVRLHRDGAGRDIGWVLGIAIPWQELDFSSRTWPPKPGDELRANLTRYERPRNNALPLELSSWALLPSGFHDPARFGRLVFTASRAGSKAD
jgi:hypothetical protein